MKFAPPPIKLSRDATGTQSTQKLSRGVRITAGCIIFYMSYNDK